MSYQMIYFILIYIMLYVKFRYIMLWYVLLRHEILILLYYLNKERKHFLDVDKFSSPSCYQFAIALLQLWDMVTGELLRTLIYDGAPCSVIMDRQEMNLIVGLETGDIICSPLYCQVCLLYLLWNAGPLPCLKQSLEFVVEMRILAEMKIENRRKYIYLPWKKVDKHTFLFEN